MVEIEEALHKLHALEKAKREQDQAEAQVERMEQDVSLPPPFACVDAVTQGSPAYQAVRFNPPCSLIICEMVRIKSKANLCILNINTVINVVIRDIFCQ